MELSPLIKKIGHSLVEIRVRALKSILSKLDHSLITVTDIVQEKMLFVYLLEWFNFPEVPMKEEVLELLLTLAKHPSSAQMLRDVGAVDFLSQLSPTIEPRLRAVIDGTLDQLFQLPELVPSHSAVYSHGPCSATTTAPTLVPVDDNVPKMGYFHNSMHHNTNVPPQKIAVRESVRCLKFSVFPWLTLTNTDRHILSSNESSLGSSNPNMVRTTCELLCDVILQDFPAEIFLQRPGIVKNLLLLLRVGSGKGEVSYLHSSALSCLRQLCVGLKRRLRFHQDPGFYSAKQDPVSQNSSFSYTQEVRGNQRSQASSPAAECSPRPSVVGRTGQRARGDGQDGDAASNSGSSHGGGARAPTPQQTPRSPVDAAHLELPDMSVEDVLELQLQQLSVAQFAVATMQHAIPLLKTEGLHAFHRVLELLCDALLLLGDSVCELVWDDRSLVGMELKEKLQACMEQLGDILFFHQDHSAEAPHSSQVSHRMAYLGTAMFTIRLLQTILPPEKASENLPENAATAIFHLCLDSSLGSLLPSMQETAVAYLEQVNSDSHDLYRRVNRAAFWMESTCNFVKEAQAEGEKNWLDLVELADHAIDGLPFHQHLPIVKECVHMCSYLWKFDQPSPLLQTESQKLFLKLLSHPSPPVKTETYECTLNLVKDCLGIQSLSRQEAAACAGVNFLLHHRVLYEMSVFGLQDSAQMVNIAAKDILLFLLKGRLMMTARAWDRFNEALYPVIPILQGYASTEESLGKCVLLISDMSDVTGDDVFPTTDKLKAALRLLFSKQPTVRVAAVHHILPHLTSHADANPSSVFTDQSVAASLPNLFCLRDPVDVTLDTINKSILKVESVEKLFCILDSETVDISLRRSAAEQLFVVLQDKSMHSVLTSLGITERVISLITDNVNGNKSLDCLLEPCVCILRKLVYADPSLRHSLAQHNRLLLTLLRASLILKEIKGNNAEVAVLMCLLLFDEIACIETWSDKSTSDATLSPFSLPVAAVRRYNIPFKTATHHAVSPYCCILAPSSDLLSLSLARQALQVAWNAAWHSGIDNLLEKSNSVACDADGFHPDLKLSKSQLLLLRAAHPPAALRDCIQAIETAAGHKSVASALSRLSLYLLFNRLALPHVPTHSCRDILQLLGWQTVLTRFLQVRPASVEDERLLVGIVTFLNAYFKQIPTECTSDQGDQDLRWILELLLNQETAALLHLLLGMESQMLTQSLEDPEEIKSHVNQRLQRELIKFFNTLLIRLSNTTDRLCLALAGPFKSQLALRLLQSLRLSDAPRFYGLPSLERALQGMVSLTAQPGWSSHCPDLEPSSLCSKYLSGLLEVISSFYVEWRGNSLSFMGKGVTKNAIICLLHLSHEMMMENKDKDFISQWSFGANGTTEESSGSQLGLAWLIPLWVDRDQEVRFASLSLGAALSSMPSGCQILCASCQNISGGLWGTLLNILVDQQESSMVRREAVFILQNLLVMPMPANAEEAKDSHWQHPCVHDEVSGVSLVGLPALQALLYHCQYFHSVALSASTCYCGRYTFDLLPRPGGSDNPSLQESSLADSENSLLPWRCDPAPSVNSGRSFGSLSTLSTAVSNALSKSSRLNTLKVSSPVDIPDYTPARLMAQGQSDRDTSNSSASQDSQPVKPSGMEAVVIVTPDLLTAHCGLLYNLLAVLPDFTLSAIQENQLLPVLSSVVDVELMEKCLSELRSPGILPGIREDVKRQFVTALRFLSSFCKLLQSCVMASKELIGQMDFLKLLLPNLVAALMLDAKLLDAGTWDAVCACWTDVFTLLATLVRRGGSAAHSSISAVLGRCWRTFAGTLSQCLDEKRADLLLHTAALQFLSTVFTEETRLCGTELKSSTSKHSSTLSNILNGPSASELCELLLQSFEKRTLQDPLKKLTARALMTLLACSPTAQNHAATAGLIDSCVEQLKQTHSRLHLESIRPSKASTRKKDGGHLKEVKLTAGILRSALYCNDECKVVAMDARLALRLYALWPWLLLDDPTMEAVLELLCVYTADSQPACSSLCGSSPSGVPGSKGSSNASLMHSVMKLSSLAPDNSPIQNLCFSLLTNLVVSRDCRCILQKNNFLQTFLSVPVPKVAGAKASSVGGGGNLLSLWLRFLVSLSATEDGQQNILKLSGVLELLAELAPHRPHALLTFHNLCFCPAVKSHVVTNDKAMKVLLRCLESKELETCCIGASALWALLHNNQRAKTVLKCPSVRLKIQEALTVSKKDAEKKQEPLNSYLQKCLDQLSQLLKS
ncbi:PREDICTED: rotatin isoform X1 [Poecilia mexicana]|uniref:Rotatin N-terminal domain-containing protein n=1 Tax=Poecilia mexicana TaxID=48701 RepID=A0A3B3YBG4_9TELE|nr:PREDICTED: rotatin isoform X1 [Poecilia mexicana]